jgi:uncharacterized protein YndB with AHSA1/START domain
MPITTVKSDPAALTLTVVGDYPVPVERLWDAWSDPRQLEKFWGPETWPATFTRHDMAEGGESHYYMTGPDGAKSSGWWHFLKVVPGRSFEIEDGFSREDGSRNTDMPSMTMVFTFEGTAKGSRFTSVTRFPSVEAMEELVKMGMMEGLKSAMGQMDGVLADLASFAASRATEAQILSDTQVRITRVIRGTVEQVWRAHHDAALMKRWLLGPDGWTMPVCNVATKVGGRYRYEWESSDGAKRSAAWADLAIGKRTVRVYNVHLSNRDGKNYMPLRGRLAQATVVLGHWLAERKRHPEKPGIILGDFNTMGDLFEPHKPEPTVSLMGRYMRPNMLRFLPTMYLPYKTDWIFSNALSLRRSRVIPTLYSDHYVVVADYRI